MTGGALRLICIDSEAPPLFQRMTGDGVRLGYEPAAAALVAEQLGRPLEWVVRPWGEMIPSLQAGQGDGIWCGQGITAERMAQMDFTRPYAVFDESVLVRRGAGIGGPADLAGRRVAAIAGSANMTLARTFTGADLVAFDGSSDDVFGEMLDALRTGDVDAVVDDDVVFVPLDEDPAFEVAFTAPTRNPWGVGVAKDRPDTLRELDDALGAVIADGRLERVWRQWIPNLPFPLGEQVVAP